MVFGLQNPKTSSPFHKFSNKFFSTSFPIGKNKLSAKAWNIWYFPHLVCSATKKTKSQLPFEHFQASVTLCLPVLLRKDWSQRFPEKVASDLSGFVFHLFCSSVYKEFCLPCIFLRCSYASHNRQKAGKGCISEMPSLLTASLSGEREEKPQEHCSAYIHLTLRGGGTKCLVVAAITHGMKAGQGASSQESTGQFWRTIGLVSCWHLPTLAQPQSESAGLAFTGDSSFHTSLPCRRKCQLPLLGVTLWRKKHHFPKAAWRGNTIPEWKRITVF